MSRPEEEVFICFDCEKEIELVTMENLFKRNISIRLRRCDKCRHKEIRRLKRSIKEGQRQLEILAKQM